MLVTNSGQIRMYDSLLSSFPPKLQYSILLACEKGTSSWLILPCLWSIKVMPYTRVHFVMPFAFAMVGSLNCYHPIVSVER